MKLSIVGGGYAGFNLARLLDRHVDVTLIEPRDAFVHNVAAIRATVEPKLLDRIILPYDRLLSQGKLVRARAEGVDKAGVSLTGGERIAADAVIVATGSHYAAPFKPQGDSITDFRNELNAVSAQIACADRIVIVGAGAVGVELAGEIKTAYPTKTVMMVSDQHRLFPSYPERLHAALIQKLLALGIVLHLGQAAKSLKQSQAPFDGTIELADGSVLSGLVIPAIGAHMAASPAHSLPGTNPQPNGQLAVDRWLRPSSLPNIFALGDLAATGEGMTVVSTMRQVPWLAKTLRKLAQGSRIEDLPAYKCWKTPPILLPLGPAKGASVLPFGKGWIVGDRVTSAVKGKQLFIPRYHKEFGL